jgi:hypothetical protein
LTRKLHKLDINYILVIINVNGFAAAISIYQFDISTEATAIHGSYQVEIKVLS